jgi:hypothetical protein
MIENTMTTAFMQVGQCYNLCNNLDWIDATKPMLGFLRQPNLQLNKFDKSRYD